MDDFIKKQKGDSSEAAVALIFQGYDEWLRYLREAGI